MGIPEYETETVATFKDPFWVVVSLAPQHADVRRILGTYEQAYACARAMAARHRGCQFVVLKAVVGCQDDSRPSPPPLRVFNYCPPPF